jgi:UDP-N-acetylmuramate--alanine ligase
VTYGTNPQADVRFTDVAMDGGKSDLLGHHPRPAHGEVTELKDLVLPMPGLHNVSNATAAIAVASQLGVGPDRPAKGISGFGGVKRRFTHTGTVGGVQIFDDYGHHPVEIRAVLHAARESTDGKVIAVMQPHRYSRLHSLFDDFSNCFNDADAVIIAPVYAAGEQPIEGASHTDLVSGHEDAGAPATCVPSRGRKSCRS